MNTLILASIRKLTLISLLFVAASLISCANQPTYRTSNTPLTTVNHVDLAAYLGNWYEIYRLPNWFEKSECSNVSAEYSLREDGNIKVVNSCTLASGQREQAIGIAKVVDSQSNSKLKVSFFRPFYGDYWILGLAPDYSWVIVGEPEGKYLWILSRSTRLSPELEKQLLDKVRALGYNTNDLIKPIQFVLQ